VMKSTITIKKRPIRGGVIIPMVNVFVTIVVNRGFSHSLGQSKDYCIKVDIVFFPTKHAAVVSKSKGWLAQSQEVSKWSDLSICRLMFQ